MVKDDLKQFENRTDDWLAKERKYEDLVSAWDLDEAKKIKIEHRQNCEAKEIKERHAYIHKNSINPNNIRQNNKSPIITIIAVLVVVNVLSSIFFEETNSMPVFFIGILIAVFIIINNSKGGNAK